MDGFEDRIPNRGVVAAGGETWENAVRAAAVVAPLAELARIGHDRADSAAAELGVSRRQVYLLLRRWRTGEGLVSDLIPARSSGGRGQTHLSTAVEAIVAETIRF